jgi:hypothetical protein
MIIKQFWKQENQNMQYNALQREERVREWDGGAIATVATKEEVGKVTK